MATEGALRNGSGGLTEIELISIALEKLHVKAAKHCRYWLRNGQRVNRSVEKSQGVILENLGCKTKWVSH